MDTRKILKCENCSFEIKVSHMVFEQIKTLPPWFKARYYCDNCLQGDLKTENLTFKEACAAIGQGECVKNQRTGDIFGPSGVWFAKQQEWILDFLPCKGIYKITPDPSKQVEEKPSLTYEEALECDSVCVNWPDRGQETFNKVNGYSSDEKLIFDLAERRGYRMEKVE